MKKVILAKKENREDSTQAEPPKLLLKSKPKPESSKLPIPPTAISIAVRESASANVPAKTPITIQSGSASTASSTGVSIARDLSDINQEPKASAPVESSQIKYKQMTTPLSLINDHYQIDPTLMSFLSDSNDSFHVVGVIGSQSTGKSTLLNLFAAEMQNASNGFFGESDLFDTNRFSENKSCNPTTDGINMFVTADRLILLDSSPVLCNPYKKDVVLSEIDDLKIVSFMLSVCHTLLVVEEEAFNSSMLRLLCCADMMRLSMDKDKTDKLPTTVTTNSSVHHPHVMFVHNFAKPNMFLPTFHERLSQTYLSCLKHTELRVLSGNPLQDRAQSRRPQPPAQLNLFTFPKVPKSMLIV